jgi:hypothetical protein
MIKSMKIMQNNQNISIINWFNANKCVTIKKYIILQVNEFELLLPSHNDRKFFLPMLLYVNFFTGHYAIGLPSAGMTSEALGDFYFNNYKKT